MREIILDDKKYAIPETWEELSFLQQEIIVTKFLPAIDKLFINIDGKKQPVSNDLILQLHILTLQVLMNMKDELFKIPLDHIHLLINDFGCTKFVFSELGPINLKKRKWKRLVGPGDFIEDLTIEELLIMSKFYRGYKEGNQNLLLPFLACIYRPISKGVKVPFNLKNVHLREHTVKSMPLGQKLLTIRWFEATLAKLEKIVPNIPKSKNTDSNPMELILQMAKDGPFGDFEQTKKVAPDVFYLELNRVAKEIAELEKSK